VPYDANSQEEEEVRGGGSAEEEEEEEELEEDHQVHPTSMHPNNPLNQSKM